MGAATLSSDPPQPKHSNLYVSGLGSLQTEAEIVDLFSSYGHVETCRLVRNARDTKTFAFVKFSTIPESLAAIAGLNKKTVAGAVLEVKTADADAGDRNPELLAPPSDNLYAKNLPKNLTEDELRALFSPYGSVIECRVLHSGTARSDSGTGAGALIRMATVDEAAQAIAHLHNQRLAGSVMPLVVRFADSQEQKAKKAARQAKREPQVRYMAQPQHYGMSPPLHEVSSYTSHSSTPHMGSPGYYSPVHAAAAAGGGGGAAAAAFRYPASSGMMYSPASCSVYIKHLPEQTDRLWLYEKFAPFGGVMSVRVLTTETGICRGVGFINYADPDSAARAVAAMNGMPMGGDRRLYVALQTHRQQQQAAMF